MQETMRWVLSPHFLLTHVNPCISLHTRVNPCIPLYMLDIEIAGVRPSKELDPICDIKTLSDVSKEKKNVS